jgi:Tol biopolymer transport system component
LAFSANDDGDAEIWLLNVQSGAVTQLTDNAVDDTSPQWEPAGVPAAR